MKVLIVLCMGVIAVQAFPKLQASPAVKDDFDDLLNELDILNNITIIEQLNATKVLTDGFKNVRELSDVLDTKIVDDLLQASGIWVEQVDDLERQASDYDVNIAECIGERLEAITDNLPSAFRYGADVCANYLYQKVAITISDGLVNTNLIVVPIQDYPGQIQQCRDSDASEQETCLTKLSTEIKNDQIQTPVKFHLVLDETLASIELDKTILRLCFDDQVEQYNISAGNILAEITECAERLFPSSPATH